MQRVAYGYRWIMAAVVRRRQDRLDGVERRLADRGCVDAVAFGLGITLTRHAITLKKIASGQLVRLFDVVARYPLSYYFACTKEAMNKPQVQAFYRWPMEEVRNFKAQKDWLGRARAVSLQHLQHHLNHRMG